jgi:HPt (histidine-containing phosphotransfer) domain-containing protein
MTANVRSEDRARCMEAGMDDFVAKPVVPAQLYATLARWLPPRHARTPLGDESPDSQEMTLPQTLELPAGDPNVIDLAILSRSVGGNPQKIRRYASLFVEAMPETLAELQTTLATGDLRALADLGHRLKSSSRMVGAIGFSDLCQSLEAFRSGGTIDQASAVIEKMPAILAQVSAAVGKALAPDAGLNPSPHEQDRRRSALVIERPLTLMDALQ